VAALALTALAAADTPVIVDTDMALDDARARIASGHLRLFDEAVVLRLANPDAWRAGTPGADAVREQFLGVLSSLAESRE
jgi:hypothetical protein